MDFVKVKGKFVNAVLPIRLPTVTAWASSEESDRFDAKPTIERMKKGKLNS